MSLKTRVAVLEEWERCHRTIHKLEQRAIKVARKEMTRRLNDHNDIAKKVERCVLAETYEKERKELASQIGELRLALSNFISASAGRQQPISGIWNFVVTLLIGLILFLVGHFAWK